MPRPWFHETPEPHLFNEWTWTHFAWGMASAGFARTWWSALLLHTMYEAVEGRIFPLKHRDASMLNHVGDTVAFLAGRAAVQASSHARRSHARRSHARRSGAK